MARTERKKRSHFADLCKLAVFTLVLVYAVGTIISTQADIAEQKEQIAKLQAEIIETRQENDEYLRILNETDEREYMLTVAVERLGYAYPRETRFYVKPSGK
ncbi:MAG: septum formation initiator family protein [Oscillospiraceae bacterium]|nr:septum formation initiator family protein [Oscillospiraceae bacterium]